MKLRSLSISLAAAAAVAVAAPVATAARYELTSLSGRFSEKAPFQEIDLGSAAALQTSLSFSIVNRPRAVLSQTRRAAKLPLRFSGSGAWSLRYEFSNRHIGKVSLGTCGDPFTLVPKALPQAHVRLVLLPASRVRVSLTVPAISVFPYDCLADAQYVLMTRTYRLATFARNRFALRLRGTARASGGEVSSGEFSFWTRAWDVTLVFRRL